MLQFIHCFYSVSYESANCWTVDSRFDRDLCFIHSFSLATTPFDKGLFQNQLTLLRDWKTMHKISVKLMCHDMKPLLVRMWNDWSGPCLVSFHLSFRARSIIKLCVKDFSSNLQYAIYSNALLRKNNVKHEITIQYCSKMFGKIASYYISKWSAVQSDPLVHGWPWPHPKAKTHATSHQPGGAQAGSILLFHQITRACIYM